MDTTISQPYVSKDVTQSFVHWKITSIMADNNGIPAKHSNIMTANEYMQYKYPTSIPDGFILFRVLCVWCISVHEIWGAVSNFALWKLRPYMQLPKSDG